MDDAYAVYSPDGKPTLVPSAVMFMDILGTSTKRTDEEAQTYLALTHEAFERARQWGESAPGADELKIAAWFSDNLVMALPLQGGLTPGHVVDLLIMYAAQHQLALNDAGLFARGAITFGPFFADKHFVHGPALNEAYELESGAAGAPRIILSPSATAALRGPMPEDDLGGLDVHVAAGDDGVPFVDYLDYTAWTVPQEFIMDMLNRHRDHIATNVALSGGNLRIAQKYEWLASYFDSRMAESGRIRPDIPQRQFPQIRF